MSRDLLKGGGIDLRAIIQNIFHLWKGKFGAEVPGPVDGPVLRMHYRWTFYFLIGGFMTVWYGWYYGPIIHCVTSFNSDLKARNDYENICLSYPYVKDGDQRRYILYYRWIHWTFLLLSMVFYIPRKISKSLENPKAKKILQDLSTLHPRYDQAEKEAVQRANFYIVSNFRTQDALYWKQLGTHLATLIIDIGVLRFLDFMLHSRFINLVPNAYPFTRNVTHFSDYISETFPPFVFCTLNEKNQIVDGREENLGCHLTNMELYEKLFLMFWFVLYLLIVCTCLYIVFLMFMATPLFKRHFLRSSKPLGHNVSVSKLIEHIASKSKVGDIYMLYRFKSHLSHMRYYELLNRLANDKMLDMGGNSFSPSAPSPPVKPPEGRYQDNIAMSADFLSEKDTKYNPVKKRGHKDTSILIS